MSEFEAREAKKNKMCLNIVGNKVRAHRKNPTQAMKWLLEGKKIKAIHWEGKSYIQLRKDHKGRVTHEFEWINFGKEQHMGMEYFFQKEWELYEVEPVIN